MGSSPSVVGTIESAIISGLGPLGLAADAATGDPLGVAGIAASTVTGSTSAATAGLSNQTGQSAASYLAGLLGFDSTSDLFTSAETYFWIGVGGLILVVVAASFAKGYGEGLA
jgi:hypothetical protein